MKEIIFFNGREKVLHTFKSDIFPIQNTTNEI